MKKRLVVIGGGQHAKVVLDAVLALDEFEVVGLVDAALRGSSVLGFPVLGGDDLLPELFEDGVSHAALGLGDNHLRQNIARRLQELQFALPPIIHPAAHVSPFARIGHGTVVLAQACVGPDASIGAFAIVNTGAIVEHDCLIGDSAHLAPGSALAGAVHVGSCSLMGVGCSVRPGVVVGQDSVVGAGAAVVFDVPDNWVVVGVPAKPIHPERKGPQ